MSRRIAKRKTTLKFCSNYIFNSHFEERKICEYLINLIRSVFYSLKPQQLFIVACSFIGTTALDMLREKHPDLITEDNMNEFDRWDGNFLYIECCKRILPISIQQLFLKEDALPLLSGKLKTLSQQEPSEMERRLDMLQTTFRLSSTEMAIITLRYLITGYRFLDEWLGNDRSLVDFTNLATLKCHGEAILGIDRGSIAEAFARGRLTDMNILRVFSNRSFDLEDWCATYLSGVGDRDLNFDFFTKGNASILSPADFDLPAEELHIVEKLILSEKPHNILIYGPPGTGKTSFVGSLARFYGKELLTVRIPKDDDHRNRIQAMYATINFTGSDTALILIDEADNLLNTFGSFVFESQIDKSWINNFLDTHGRKIVWITNRLHQMDPSTMRRFSFALEFKTLNKKSRLRVFKSELARRGLVEYFSDDDLKDLCDNHAVSADGIVKAINMVEDCGVVQKDRLIEELKTILSNHEKVIAVHTRRPGTKKDLALYSLEGLNTSHDLISVISVTKRYLTGGNGGDRGCARSLTLLLYGLPGTGKTEFVHYLGRELGKEVVIQRCSEIESMWVGETEKNIAEAFREAQSDGAILFFDEADSFLFPRKNAQHSWEKTFTNEMLAQLDNYAGIAVFATNEIEGLDHAAIRRFKFKIEFRPLTQEGNLHFYNTLLAPMVKKDGSLCREEVLAIADIPNLTPGDFAVVRDQFLLEEPEAVTHERLIASLIVEAGHKGNAKKIGFV